MFGARCADAHARVRPAAALVAPLTPATGIAPPQASGGGARAHGVALGFSSQLGRRWVAGQLLATQGSCSPSTSTPRLSTAALGQLYIILATLTFLALGGHLALLEVLVQGFTTLPIGTTGLGREGLWNLVLWGGQLFAGAISIALPGVTALLIVNLAFGVVSRAAPSLNLFAVGFPISLVVGLLVVLAGIGPLQEGVAQLIAQGFDFLRLLMGA